MCFSLWFSATAHATPLIADLSSYHIDIDSSFRGARLYLFGARNDSGRLYVVLQGPSQTYTVQKKERIMGIWLVSQQLTFENVPQLYTLIQNKNPFDPAIQPYLEELNIGLEHLPLIPRESVDEATRKEFADALVQLKQQKRLYTEGITPLKILGESLFKAPLDFPDSMTQGTYMANVYLLNEQGVVGMQSLPIQVKQQGLEALISMTAKQLPWLYAFIAVGMALLLGWLANTLLRRLNLNG